MALTRYEIVEQARDRIGSADVQVFTPLRVGRAFNRVQRRLARLAPCLSDSVTLNQVAGTQEYNLNTPSSPNTARLFEIRRVVHAFSNGGDWWPLRPMLFDHLPADYESFSGTPSYWSHRGTLKLILYPKPAASVTNGIGVDYYYLPTPLSEDTSGDNTSLELPDTYEDALVAGLAAALCEIGLEDGTLAARYPLFRDEFEREAKRLRAQEDDPGRSPYSLGGDVMTGRARDDRASLLPGNWGVER